MNVHLINKEMADLKAFAEQLVNLTVKEVNELATILKDEYGIDVKKNFDTPQSTGSVKTKK